MDPVTDPCPLCSTLCYGRNMATEITQRELRNNSGEIMRQLDRGESFIVTRNGVPVGELTPLYRDRFVSAASAIAAFRGAPRVDLDRLRADLDDVADQEITPRG
jgi:prevent-host-death family protein